MDSEVNFPIVLNFTKKFLLPANIESDDVRVGLINFASNVKVEFYLNTFSSKQEMFHAIDNVQMQGSMTNTPGAIRVMNDVMFTKKRGDRPDARNIGIILTDGGASIDVKQLGPESERAKLNGIHLFVIGIGHLINREELKSMASAPYSKNAFVLDGFSQLRVFDERFFQFCPGI